MVPNLLVILIAATLDIPRYFIMLHGIQYLGNIPEILMHKWNIIKYMQKYTRFMCDLELFSKIWSHLLSMCVCVCVCVHARVRVCVYACARVCVHACMCVRERVM